MKSLLLAASLLALGPFAAFAQQAAAPNLPVPRNLQATYTKGTRSPDGQPGPNYWQNTADYAIKVNFDPATRRVQGTVDIKYQNNSPDELPRLLLKLYPNLYQQGAPRASRMEPEDIGEGVKIEALAVNGQAVDAAKWRVQATNMLVPLPQALGSMQSTQLTIAYSYTLNKSSHMRTGEIEPGADFVAYFFPRVAVYDDIDGWNEFAYNGQQEFYNDFCNFTADITVPRDFLVWATGDLTNAEQVLGKAYLKRLREAEKKDGYTTIVSRQEAERRGITAPNAQNTWHFEARDVTDFAFATADHYVWQATSLVVDPKTKRRTRVDAVYNPKHQDYEEVVQFGRKTVEAMSYTFPKWPFPYPHITVFDGLDQMEYPMMVNDNPVETRADAITLTDHEIFHTMFPFYMGTNETKYGWMDEGWATIGEWLISSIIAPKLDDDYGIAPYAGAAATEVDVPIATLSTQQTGTAFFLNSYPKPGLGYLYVKDMLGDELFTKALHHYIETWHGKHPMPYDFFNAMNAGASRNLNWFWQRWFFDAGYPDLAIQSVTKQGAGYDVLVAAKGSKPVPIDLTITYTDGTTQQAHRSVAVWETGARTVTVNVPGDKAVKQVKLGSTLVPDSYPQDNVWTGR
ncbi:M1 family metallopeptidase [Hymenobacter sp. 15J16-1T3B]|uniref:M1 family metallopeptidase n=1 Tax=Hymenobacter sp. 15J16-1T3B TaxID=2886941 RepID=UPI001D12643D|nr:M1 family metallopeptidase [Hymenobacter sp. 15J16-1T3B]MCC3159294.1 M1 family metallopeptidase [Hymenobacter sp. 15J16-1T3B]